MGPHFVDVIEPRPVKDSAGQPIPTPFTVCPNVPVSIEAVTGGETRRGQQMHATATTLLKMVHPFGEFDVLPTMYLNVVGEYRTRLGVKEQRRINVVRAYDPKGTNRELWIEGREDG